MLTYRKFLIRRESEAACIPPGIVESELLAGLFLFGASMRRVILSIRANALSTIARRGMPLMLSSIISLASIFCTSTGAWMLSFPVDATERLNSKMLTASSGEELGLAFCVALLIPTAVMLARAIRLSHRRHRRTPSRWTEDQ